MRNRTRERGFTLVELLVVISIIGVLSAILLPAVNAARAAARQSECQNNVRNVTQAVLNYSASRNAMPSIANAVWTDSNSPPNQYVAGLIYSILPMIEQNVIRDEIDDLLNAAKVAGATPIPIDGDYHLATPLSGNPVLKILTCPSNPSTGGGQVSSGYVGNGGHTDFVFPGTNTPADFRANGSLSSSFAGANFKNTSDFISSHDGTSQTAIVSENLRFASNGTSSDWRPAFVSSASYTNDFAQRVQNPHSFLWDSRYDDASAPTGIAGLQLVSSPVAFPGFNNEMANDVHEASTPSSFHRGGFMVGFADGHVTALNEGISYRVYARLLTSDGRNVTTVEATPFNPQANFQRKAISQDELEGG